MIPKTIHVIWVGNESKRPDNCIETWRSRNPDWSIKIWGNDALASYGWVNAKHMRVMAERELNGVADMMRWEILYNEGGLVVDADSVCVRRLEDWLFDCEAFACWESELSRPGLVAAGYVASVPENLFFGQIVLDIKADQSIFEKMAWETVGPLRLTQSIHRYGYSQMTIWPSHFFIPEHFSGAKYSSIGHVFARQEWASTRKSYDQLHLKAVA